MNKKIRVLIFVSLYVALAIVLDYIKEFIPFLNMPTGGSINIALIPICVASFHLGSKNGVAVGLLWWLISSVLGLNKWFVSIAQYIMDYVVPSGVVGLCSLFYRKKNVQEIVLGIIFVMLIRTLCIVISGAVYWPGELASGSLAAWAYSLSYNLPYSLLTTLMLIVLVPLILKSLKKYLV